MMMNWIEYSNLAMKQPVRPAVIITHMCWKTYWKSNHFHWNTMRTIYHSQGDDCSHWKEDHLQVLIIFKRLWIHFSKNDIFYSVWWVNISNRGTAVQCIFTCMFIFLACLFIVSCIYTFHALFIYLFISMCTLTCTCINL